MDCREFEERLFERTEGELSAAFAVAMHEHAAGCNRCRDLETAVMTDDGSAELTVGILTATTGTVCERVREVVCERLDLGSGAGDDLLAMHLESCPECAALERALTMLTLELPDLAEMPVDGTFLDGVIAATSAALPPRARVTVTVAPLSALWMRPRIALEGAYVGTLLIALLVGPSASAFTGVPAQVIREVRARGAAVEQVVAKQITGISTAGLARLEPTAARIATYVASIGGDAETRATWGASVRAALATVWERQVQPLLRGLVVAWQQITAWIFGGDGDRSSDNNHDQEE